MRKTLISILFGLTLAGCDKMMPEIYLNAPQAKGYDVMLTKYTDSTYGGFRMQLGERDGIGQNDGSVYVDFKGDDGNIMSYELDYIDVKKGSPLEKMTVDSLINIYAALKK